MQPAAEAFMNTYRTDFQPMLKQRARTFQRIFETALSTGAGPVTIVETGTLRVLGNWADGQSSAMFDACVRAVGGQFISIDLSLSACLTSLAATSAATTVIWGDSIPVLSALGRHLRCPIDLLYLDSFDVDFNHDDPSAAHHLKEFALACRYLAPSAVVAIDDTLQSAQIYREDGDEDGQVVVHACAAHSGKGKYLAAYLEALGFVPFVRGYQIGYHLTDHGFAAPLDPGGGLVNPLPDRALLMSANRFTVRDGRLRQDEYAIPLAGHGGHHAIFGPYIALPAGNYRFMPVMSFDAQARAAQSGRVTLEITAAGVILAAAHVTVQDVTSIPHVCLSIHLTVPQDMIEWRLLYRGFEGGTLTFGGVWLAPVA